MYNFDEDSSICISETPLSNTCADTPPPEAQDGAQTPTRSCRQNYVPIEYQGQDCGDVGLSQSIKY
jgi:hypothetical protein